MPPSGENFHHVGLTQAFNPFSPTPQTPYGNGSPPVVAAAAERVANIDDDEDDVVETSRTAKKRHWSDDEEGRLVITYI